jgi:hypothetical protein
MGFVGLVTTISLAASPNPPRGDCFRAAVLMSAMKHLLRIKEWPAKYVVALQAMQALSAADRVKAFVAIEEAPEPAFVVSTSSALTQSRGLEWHSHMCAEPKGTTPDGGPAILSVPAVIGTEMIARVVGPAFVDAMQEPLESWAKLDQVSMFPVYGCFWRLFCALFSSAQMQFATLQPWRL